MASDIPAGVSNRVSKCLRLDPDGIEIALIFVGIGYVQNLIE